MVNASTLSFKVTGLDEASRYTYVLSVLDAQGTPIHVYVGDFATLGYDGDLKYDGDEVIPTPPIIPSNPDAKTPTGIENEGTEDSSSDGKLMLNGEIVIRHNGRIFTLTGLEIK